MIKSRTGLKLLSAESSGALASKSRGLECACRFVISPLSGRAVAVTAAPLASDVARAGAAAVEMRARGCGAGS
jgi:hypothetical protein